MQVHATKSIHSLSITSCHGEAGAYLKQSMSKGLTDQRQACLGMKKTSYSIVFYQNQCCLQNVSPNHTNTCHLTKTFKNVFIKDFQRQQTARAAEKCSLLRDFGSYPVLNYRSHFTVSIWKHMCKHPDDMYTYTHTHAHKENLPHSL